MYYSALILSQLLNITSWCYLFLEKTSNFPLTEYVHMEGEIRITNTGSTNEGLYEPLPRMRHCGALVYDRWIIYGGILRDGNLASNEVIEVFDVNTKRWKQEKTCGVLPETILSLACVSIGSDLYTFGGYRISPFEFRNTIHKLDTQCARWIQMSSNNPSDDEPMPKESAVMIAYKDKTLVTFGGYGPSPINRRDNVVYTPHPKSKEFVWTNELVCYKLDTGKVNML